MSHLILDSMFTGPHMIVLMLILLLVVVTVIAFTGKATGWRRLMGYISVLFMVVVVVAVIATYQNSGASMSPVVCSGSIQFINNTRHNYNITVGSADPQVIGASSSITIGRTCGTYYCTAKQMDGYLMIPTTKHWVVVLHEGDSKILVF